MTGSVFREQLERMKREWKHSFGEEKTALFWESLNRLSDEFMIEATNEFLANRRSAPVLKDFFEYESEFKRRETERESRSGKSALQQMREWAEYAPNKDFAKKCCSLLEEFIAKRMPSEEFHLFVDELEREACGEVKEHCAECGGNGLIFKSKEKNDFVFRCTCETGRALNQNIPLWESVLFTGFKKNG